MSRPLKIDSQIGTNLDAVLARYEFQLRDPFLEQIYGPLPDDWYVPVSEPGADRAVRVAYGSGSGDVITFALLAEVEDVVLEVELLAHIESYLEFTEDQIDAVFASLRIDRAVLLAPLDTVRHDR